MGQTLEAGSAWETLHGQFEVPKRYVPPFLKDGGNSKYADADLDSELDNIYAVEVEGCNLRKSQELKTKKSQG